MSLYSNGLTSLPNFGKKEREGEKGSELTIWRVLEKAGEGKLLI